MKTRQDRARIRKAEEKRERRRVKRGAKPKEPLYVGLLIDFSVQLEPCPVEGYRTYDNNYPKWEGGRK